MIPSPRNTNRILSLVIYLAACLLVLRGGVFLVNYSLDSKFYNEFILGWQNAAKAYSASGGNWGRFNNGNHLTYMKQLVSSMAGRNITLPRSNTGFSFAYTLEKISFGNKKEKIFLLCLPGKILIYGLSRETFQRLDGFVDDANDPGRGNFTGRLSKNGLNYTGRLAI